MTSSTNSSSARKWKGLAIRSWSALLSAGLVLTACQSASNNGGEIPPASPLPLDAQLTLSPEVAAIGQTQVARIEGISTQFSADSRVFLGDDVRVDAVSFVDEGTLDVTFTVDTAAIPGLRNLSVTTGEHTEVAGDALLLQTGSLSLNPAVAFRGQTIDLDLEIHGMDIISGYTGIDLGEGVVMEWLERVDDTHAVARVRVSSDAKPGPRDVSLNNGATRVLLPGGFTVDRGVIAIEFYPTEVEQGTEVNFTLSGYGTHFSQEATTLDLGLGVLASGTDAASYTVESPTRISGVLSVCESALEGLHDVSVSTSLGDGPPEQVTSTDAFTVLEIPKTVEKAFASGYLFVSRTMVDGRVDESISAYMTFIAAVTRCGSSSSNSSCSVQTAPYDQPSYYPPAGCDQNAGSSGTQQPPTPTLDAGEHVYFEGPGGVRIQLDREVEADGTTYYTSKLDISPDQFVFNAAYDLRTEGSDDPNGVPAFVADGALVTPPSDFYLTSPDLYYAPTLDHYDSIVMQWEDPEGNPGAHSFPLASLFARVRTLDGYTGDASEIRVIPEDDGEYVFPANYVSQLYAGQGRMSLQLSRVGPSFTVPGSTYTSALVSGITWDGLFELR